jgi:hypothetical protein
MNCQDFSLAMDDRDIGALNEAERREFDAHLSTCTECARDWDLHLRLAATPTPPLPVNLHHSIRASLPAQGRAGGRPNSGRLVIVGSLLALAAAAAVFTVYGTRTPAPAVPAAAFAPPPALPVPTLSPERVEASPATAPVVTRPVQSTATEKKRPAAQPVSAAKQRTVRLLSFQNQATGAAFTAVDAFFTAFLSNLRNSPGVAVIAPDQPQAPGAAPAELQLRVRGYGPVPEGKFSLELQFENLQPDGTYRLEYIFMPTGDIAPACASSLPVDGMQSCRSPSHLAVGMAKTVASRMASNSTPPDPQSQLLDRSLKAENRLGALLKLRELGKHTEPETIGGAIEIVPNIADPKLRAMLWKYMLGARSPLLVPALVEAVKQDPDADVRLQAMTTLAVDYPDDPRMRAALESAAQQDSKPLVRAWARRGLSGEEGWNQYMVSSLKDTSRPAAERAEALAFRLTEPRALDLQAFLNENDAVAALAEVLRTMEAHSPGGNLSLLLNPRVTALDDPAITDLVLNNLEKRPAPYSLSILGGMLKSHSDKSRIRAALEKISAGDPDPSVRQAAEKMLKAP